MCVLSSMFSSTQDEIVFLFGSSCPVFLYCLFLFSSDQKTDIAKHYKTPQNQKCRKTPQIVSEKHLFSVSAVVHK